MVELVKVIPVISGDPLGIVVTVDFFFYALETTLAPVFLGSVFGFENDFGFILLQALLT